MFNVGEYALNAEQTFAERPITDGDGMVFSAIAYGELPDIDIPFPTSPIDYVATNCRPVVLSCALSKRFADIKFLRQKNLFSEKPHCQFSGTAILFDENKIFIGFCGTDETVAGWLEDFDMIVDTEIPSQKAALEFANKIARDYPDKELYLGGHSKGGNIAVYAATFIDQEYSGRVKKVYNLDGPGFLPEVRNCKRYKDILPKVEKLVPNMSFFGMMLLGNDPVIPCKCRRFWFLQHDHYSWNISRDGEIQKGKLRYVAKKTAKLFHRLITCLSPEEKRMFVDVAERALYYGEVTSMYSMSLRSLVRTFKYILCLKNKKERKFLRFLLHELFIGIVFPIR